MKKLAAFSIIFFLCTAYSQERIIDEINPALLENISIKNNTNIEEPIIIDEEIEKSSSNQKDFNNAQIDALPFGYQYFKNIPTSITAFADLPLPSDYRISFNDQLKILLTGTSEEKYMINVGLDGKILVPGLGEFSVVSETLSEVNRMIKSRAASLYVGTDVSISISNISARKILIVGMVKYPGIYLVNPFTTISNAIAYAGGPSNSASMRSIELRKTNGKKVFLDLYDILIFGDRSSDHTVDSGDTIIISATDNIVDIKGEVLRTGKYEYLETDTFSDLLTFAQGLSKNAANNLIFTSEINNGALVTMNIDKNEEVRDRDLVTVDVGSKVFINDKDIKVIGNNVVTQGFFKAKNMKELMGELSFSDQIYPFYAEIRNKLDNGQRLEFNYFSIKDPETYENISLSGGAEVEFFSREDVLSGAKNFSKFKLIKYISEGGLNKNIPIVGNFVISDLYGYFGSRANLNDINIVMVNESGSAEKKLSDNVTSDEVDILVFSDSSISQQINISIDGQVFNPGEYLVPLGTSLNDLYSIAGGITNFGDASNVIVLRKSIKKKQQASIDEAAKSITDIIIKNLSSNLNAQSNNQGSSDYSYLLNLLSTVEVSGRISGNFLPNSIEANNLILEENDEIIVANIPSTITVSGQVLNTLTTAFDDNLSVSDYIAKTGGYTEYADKGNIYIIKANGVSVDVSGNFFQKPYFLEPGDTIIVPRNLRSLDTLPLIAYTAQIISNLAFSAASLNAIRN